MNLNQIFYSSIAACCLLMAIFAVSEVSAYEVFIEGGGGISGGGYGRFPLTDVKRYETARIYDFRNRDIAQVINIEYLENDRLPVILFNDVTVFPEGFNPYSDMFCNQLSNSDTLCFYPKL